MAEAPVLPLLNLPGRRKTLKIAGWDKNKRVQVSELTPEQFRKRVFGSSGTVPGVTVTNLPKLKRLVAGKKVSRKRLLDLSKSLDVVL